MRNDRLFRVIVLGGCSLVGGSACGTGASNGVPSDGGSAEGAEEPADARDEMPGLTEGFGEGGPIDWEIGGQDATADVGANSLRDAGAADAAPESADAGDAQACHYEYFPSESSVTYCSGTCTPTGCSCVVPSGCSCYSCMEAGAGDGGGG